MEQTLASGCVPTSVAMAFSGFGIALTEQELVDRYFPTANLPNTEPQSGVSNTDTVTGIIHIIDDLGLSGYLQLDVFIPGLCDYQSSEAKCIVKARPQAAGKMAKKIEKGTESREFFETLAKLAERGRVGIYTANAKKMKFRKEYDGGPLTKTVVDDFYCELSEFISKGHVLGPHGGMTMHMRTLDGSRIEPPSSQKREKYVIIDPEGRSYSVSQTNLIMVDPQGIRGDVFDYLFRISPKGDNVTQQDGLRKFINIFRT